MKKATACGSKWEELSKRIIEKQWKCVSGRERAWFMMKRKNKSYWSEQVRMSETAMARKRINKFDNTNNVVCGKIQIFFLRKCNEIKI